MADIPSTTPTDTSETDRLIASNKVEGTVVYSPEGERMGSVHSFMVDKYSGKVAYAVMSFGGFLGIGERYHPLPWDTLTYDTSLGGYVANASREQLGQAPHYGHDEDPWSDPQYGERLLGHYGGSGPR